MRPFNKLIAVTADFCPVYLLKEFISYCAITCGLDTMLSIKLMDSMLCPPALWMPGSVGPRLQPVVLFDVKKFSLLADFTICA